MEFLTGKGRSAVLLGVALGLGLLFFVVMDRYHRSTLSLEDTYKNIVKKNELVAQMRINLSKSVELEKSAVMAVTDEESQEFADQSRAAAMAVEENLARLRALLAAVPLPDEEKLLAEFEGGWRELLNVDRTILALAIQNTNLKAGTLSRREGGTALQHLEQALNEGIHGAAGSANEGKLARLSCRILTGAFKIYALHNAHIAETSDEIMDRLEATIQAEAEAVGLAFAELLALVDPESRPIWLPSQETYSQFMAITTEVIKLSRQNSNIKSLELSLGRKRKVAAQCDEILTAFQELVQSRTFKATR